MSAAWRPHPPLDAMRCAHGNWIDSQSYPEERCDLCEKDAEIARLTAELAALHSGDNLRAILDDDTTAMMREIEHDKAQIVSLTAENMELRKDAERWCYGVAHTFPVRGQNGKWYVVGARDFRGYATPNEAIDAARGKP